MKSHNWRSVIKISSSWIAICFWFVVVYNIVQQLDCWVTVCFGIVLVILQFLVCKDMFLLWEYERLPISVCVVIAQIKSLLNSCMITDPSPSYVSGVIQLTSHTV